MNYSQISYNSDHVISHLANHNASILYGMVFILPILNALADSTLYYFVDSNGSGLQIGLIRGVLLVIFVLIFGLKRISHFGPNYLILTFLLYLLVLSILSSNVNHSLFDGYLKWFVAMMMFPVGFYYLRNYESILKYNFILVFCALIICINLSIAQIIGFGMSAYGGEDFYTGGAGVGITNQLALILLTYPVLLRNFRRFNRLTRWFIIIIGIISFIFLLLAMKRAGIIALLGGGFVFILFTQSRRGMIKYLLIGSIIIIASSPLYRKILVNRYEARVEIMDQYDREARYLEIFYVLDEFREGTFWQKLFGSEAFNTGQFFGMKYFNRPRMIHGDFASMLYGTGLIGLGLYFGIFFILLRKAYVKLRIIKKDKNSRELLAVFFGLLFATFLISATGSGTIGERCLVYTYFGAVLGYLYALRRLPTSSANIENGRNTVNQ
jgi:hypothetical protein